MKKIQKIKEILKSLSEMKDADAGGKVMNLKTQRAEATRVMHVQEEITYWQAELAKETGQKPFVIDPDSLNELKKSLELMVNRRDMNISHMVIRLDKNKPGLIMAFPFAEMERKYIRVNRNFKGEAAPEPVFDLTPFKVPFVCNPQMEKRIHDGLLIAWLKRCFADGHAIIKIYPSTNIFNRLNIRFEEIEVGELSYPLEDIEEDSQSAVLNLHHYFHEAYRNSVRFFCLNYDSNGNFYIAPIPEGFNNYK